MTSSIHRFVGCMVFCLVILHFKNTDGAADEPVLNFKCGDDGIEFINKDKLGHVYILLNEATHLYCKPNNTKLTNCFNTTKTGVPEEKQRQELKVIYEDETKAHIIGGKQVYYFHLKCTEKTELFSASALFSHIKYNDTFKDKIKNIALEKVLTLKISNTPNIFQEIHSVKVGQTFYLILGGPAGHVISPEECTAKPSKPQNAEKVKLWKSTGNDSSCNDFDSNLIDQKWIEKTEHLSIRMYAFRFDSSDEVTITCTAFVCSSSDKSSNCTRLCVTSMQQSTSRRRRYAIVGPQRTEKSASASFRVVPKDNPNVAADLSPTPVVFVFLLFAVIKWKCMEF